MIQSEYLNDSKITHYISEISDGNMSFTYGKAAVVKRNILKFFKKAKVRESDVYGINAEHKDNIVEITNANRNYNLHFGDESYIICDALITKIPSIALFLPLGDCIPLIMTDKKRSFVGLIHLGWKGIDIELPNKIVNFIVKKYKVNPSEIELLIGPAIRKESYIKKEFIPENQKVWNSHLRTREDGFIHIDTIGSTIQQLTKAGILKENIFDTNIDTFSYPRFFSHYEDKKLERDDLGRFGVLVKLIDLKS